MTEELKAKIDGAETLATLEDIYLPFRPKKRTKATVAKERGLEPLADILWAQDASTDPVAEAAPFVDAAKEVPDAEAALAGARDIIAERINDDAEVRAKLRDLYLTKGVLKSKVALGKEEEGAKFKDYFDWSEPAAAAPSHRILAIRRGESEGFLYSRLTPPEEDALTIVENLFVRGKSPAAEQVRLAAQDCYKRLLGLRWRPRPVFSSRRRPTRKPSAFSPRTCASCCSPRRWGKRRCSPSIPASARAARWSCSTARASCSRTKSSTPRRAPASRSRPPRCCTLS